MTHYFELRQYPMLPGRLAEFHDLMGDKVPPLFVRYGFGQPAGFWESHAGRFSPSLIYLLPWKSLSARNAAWNAFYADADWNVALKANFAGAPRVDHAHVTMLARSPLAEDSQAAEGQDELWLLDAASAEDAEEAMRAARRPGGLAEGAIIRGAFRTAWGGSRSQIAVFVTWPGGEIAVGAAAPGLAAGISLTRQRLLTLPYGKPQPILTDARHG